jgi:hypothetical protein
MTHTFRNIRLTAGAAIGLAVAMATTPERAGAQIAPMPVHETLKYRAHETQKHRTKKGDPCEEEKKVETQWRFMIAPYVNFTNIRADAGLNTFSTPINGPFSGSRSRLRFGGGGAIEADYGPWLITNDQFYTSQHYDQTTLLNATTPTVDFRTKFFMSTTLLGYSWMLGDNFAADLLGGVRVWSIRNSFFLLNDPLLLEQSSRRTWVDAIGGARLRFKPAREWDLSVAGDGGGGGSKSTWDVMGTVAYEFDRHWSLFAAYHYTHVDYHKNDLGFFFNGHVQGPAIGIAYRWGGR